MKSGSNGFSKILLLLLTALILFNQCGKVVPVKDLGEARAEIEEAELVNSQELAPEKFSAARAALLSAHRNLADEKQEAVASDAKKALNLALEAREKATPLFVSRLKDNIRSVLNDAREMNAESLAPEAFLEAQKLYNEGAALHETAEAQNLGSGDIDTRHGVLRIYLAAYQKYLAAQEAAAKALQMALSSGGGLNDSIAAIEALLRKAEEYQAPELVPELYNQARSDLEKARTLVSDNAGVDALKSLQVAESSARAALDGAMELYAAKIKADAERVVGVAEKNYNDNFGSSQAANLSEDQKRIVENTGETLNAAKEALQSAGANYEQKKFDNSISDSQEAIRLAAIIDEQVALLLSSGQKVAVRETQPQPVDLGGWQKYTVVKKKPAECLWRIAGKKNIYGNPRLWRKIYRANMKTLRDPNLIYPGQVLNIPPKHVEFDKDGNIIGGEPAAPVEESSDAEAPAEEQPIADETPIDEATTEENSVEGSAEEENSPGETPVEETPAEELPADENIPVEESTEEEETPVEENGADAIPSEEAPAEEETPVEEGDAEDLPTEEAPAEEETPVEDGDAEDLPTEEGDGSLDTEELPQADPVDE